MKRRSFLEKMLLAGAGLAIGFEPKAWGLPPARVGWLPQGRRVPLMQGMTNETSTQIIVLAPRSEVLAYAVMDSRGRAIAVKVQDKTIQANSRYQTERLVIQGLNSKEIYQLQILSRNGDVIDTRTFKGLAVASGKLKFGLMSCMDDRNSNQAAMWAEVIRQKADALFFIGDNVYVDSEDIMNSEEYIWGRYVETRMNLDIFQVEQLIPVLATWDDHDYGVDDGNRHFLLKDSVQKTFKAFFGSVETQGYKNGPGVANVFSAFGQRFVFLDDRSYREASRPSRFAGSVEQWGREQMNWLNTVLDKKSADPVWVFNGTQYFGKYQNYESVERASFKELDQLTNFLKQLKAPVILGSGDVHYSEVMNLEDSILGYASLELTSSAIHSTPADSVSPNSRRSFATAENNFMMIESAASTRQVDLTISILGAAGAVYYNAAHSVKKNS